MHVHLYCQIKCVYSRSIIGDCYHKYSLLHILRAFGAFVLLPPAVTPRVLLGVGLVQRAVVCVRIRDPIESTIHNLEALSDHLEAVAVAKTQEIMEQRQKIEAILHSILPK